MDYSKIFTAILDIGAEMIRSGAETHRVEDSLYRLCAAYRFEECNIWVIPSNIQATATSPEGNTETQIRYIRRAGINFGRLDRLNDLSRRLCADPLPETELSDAFREVMNSSGTRVWVRFVAALLAASGFGVFFNCDFTDALVAALASLLIAFLGNILARRESNPLVFNFSMASLCELFILLCVRFGFGHHTGFITVGVVMLLISGLGTTNGVRDLVHLDTLSGVMNISVSFTGAVGIALGIALPLMLLRGFGTTEAYELNPNIAVGLVACTVGCVGFALWFNTVKLSHILSCAVGTAMTWGVYLAAQAILEESYPAILLSAVFCAAFSEIAARLNKAPATIFRTICIFPLIPGASLYYMMYGIVTRDGELAYSMGISLLLICFCIVLGFLVVEAVERFFHKAR